MLVLAVPRVAGGGGAAGSFVYFMLLLVLCSVVGLFFCQLVSLCVATDVLAISIFPVTHPPLKGPNHRDPATARGTAI